MNPLLIAPLVASVETDQGKPAATGDGLTSYYLGFGYYLVPQRAEAGSWTDKGVPVRRFAVLSIDRPKLRGWSVVTGSRMFSVIRHLTTV